jgi:hypothetical protein
MNIPVIYINGKTGLVNAAELDELIRGKKIVSFRRTSGWVRLAFDPIRGMGGLYDGFERRNRWLIRQFVKWRFATSGYASPGYEKCHRALLARVFME